MRRFITVLGLSAFLSTAALGSNPVTIINYAPYDIQYQIGNKLPLFYTIKKGGTDIYNAGILDQRVLISVSACIDLNKDGFCSTIASHMNPQYYDATKIKSIQVRSAYDYRVTCVDGTIKTCLVD